MHCEDLRNIREQSVVPAYGATGRGTGVNRAAESVALRELPFDDMKEYLAVEKTIRDTMRYPNGADRVKLIEMVFFKRTHTLHGAAMALFVSYGTAKNWHNKFIERTAENFGLTKKGAVE
jgi:hypothetical protein